jgi:hypothetical protein
MQEVKRITKAHIGGRLLVQSYILGNYTVSEIRVLEMSNCGTYVKVRFANPGNNTEWDYTNNLVILSELDPEPIGVDPNNGATGPIPNMKEHFETVPTVQTPQEKTPVTVMTTTSDQIIEDALQGRWISVRDRLPTTNGNYDVLVFGDRTVYSSYYRDGMWDCNTAATVIAWYDTPAPTMSTITRINSRYNRVV